MDDQERRAHALQCALLFKNARPWKMETVMRWTAVFERFIIDGNADAVVDYVKRRDVINTSERFMRWRNERNTPMDSQ